MDQLRFMIISHFLAGTCYGSGLQITQIPRSPQLQAGAAVPHSSVLQCYSKNSLLCPFSPTISSTCTLSKLSFCSAAFLQMVSLIFQICSMLHLSLKATLLSHALTTLLFKNLTPVLTSLNLKGWEFFLNQKCKSWNTQAQVLALSGTPFYSPVDFPGPNTGYFSHIIRSLPIKSHQGRSKS